MTQILNTGERILLEKETPLMIARHFCAYRFAKDYVINKRVLDIGCGEGYGVYYLAEAAKEATGIDYNQAVINYAKDKYKRENLRFYCLDIGNISDLNHTFDVACSFQVIEHIRDSEDFLNKVKKILTPPGVFICSTPNRLDASPGSKTPLNKFHMKEYLYREFAQLLSRHFKEMEIYGLKRGGKLNFYRRLKKIGIFNFLPASLNPVQRFYRKIECDNFYLAEDKIDTALDFIAVCRV